MKKGKKTIELNYVESSLKRGLTRTVDLDKQAKEKEMQKRQNCKPRGHLGLKKPHCATESLGVF
jgi:hypothetical protein